ncbi:MAG: lipid A biosynthesis acyltransferase [Rhodoferax sp.]|nr:lipid A biosynthesis acyltransferase [Rhodoferax sp.]
MLGILASHAGVWFMRSLAWMPLSWLRGLGWLLGRTLYLVARSRRRVAWVNLRLCFPDWSDAQLKAVAVGTFVHFAQAWLDRGWLWHAAPAVTARRLQIVGALDALAGESPVVIFAPHFVGLDAGWTALTQQLPRQFTTIYTNQANQVVDQWILRGRQRFGRARLFGRVAGVKSIVAALRAGEPLYLLPDMNFGPEESIYVPFCGVMAATVPSLSRFSKLGRASVVPVVTRMTRSGYQVEVMPAWRDFPTDDVVADTSRMNHCLEGYIETMPDQYYWVHKRFKSRPAGEAPVY